MALARFLDVTWKYWYVWQRRSAEASVAVLYPCVYALQANKMAGVNGHSCKFEVRAVVRFMQAEGVSQSRIHGRLVSVYGQNVCSRKEASVWCIKFKDG
jgi:hypothetical protein